MKEKKPNLFIVGAPKAGTSSLYSYLSNHPEIYVPSIKETHHFSCPDVKETYYKVDFIESLEEYLALYNDAGEQKWLGDFSPSYLFSDTAAQRIHAFNPDSRIVIILRDPADRAVSHYLMDRRLGIQTNSLTEAIQDNETNKLYRKEYIEMGQYYEQVKRYLDCFVRDNVFLARYEELANDPKAFVNGVLDFLGLAEISSIDTSQKYNPYRMPRSALIGRLYQSRLKGTISRYFPRSLKERIRSLAYSNDKPDMKNEKECIRTCFDADIARLEQLTGWCLDDWKSRGKQG